MIEGMPASSSIAAATGPRSQRTCDFRSGRMILQRTVAAFALYLQNLFDPVQQLSQLYNTVQSSAATGQRVCVRIASMLALPQTPHELVV